MDKAYVIQLQGGSFCGGGHAHGVPLYRADVYETYKDAEKRRKNSGWDLLETAKVVIVSVESERVDNGY